MYFNCCTATRSRFDRRFYPRRRSPLGLLAHHAAPADTLRSAVSLSSAPAPAAPPVADLALRVPPRRLRDAPPRPIPPPDRPRRPPSPGPAPPGLFLDPFPLLLLLVLLFVFGAVLPARIRALELGSCCNVLQISLGLCSRW